LETKTVGIRILRDNLSKYLKEVKSGVRLLILDRDQVVAEMHKPLDPYSSISGLSKREALLRSGTLIPPRKKIPGIKPSPIKLPEGTASQILNELRKDTGEFAS